MRAIETVKPYTMPETCTDAALVRCYWHDIQRNPRLLFGLKDEHGQPYTLYNCIGYTIAENSPALKAG